MVRINQQAQIKRKEKLDSFSDFVWLYDSLTSILLKSKWDLHEAFIELPWAWQAITVRHYTVTVWWELTLYISQASIYSHSFLFQ